MHHKRKYKQAQHRLRSVKGRAAPACKVGGARACVFACMQMSGCLPGWHACSPPCSCAHACPTLLMCVRVSRPAHVRACALLSPDLAPLHAECLEAPHLAHGIVAFIACAVFTVIAYGVTLTEFEPDPSSRRYMATPHASVEVGMHLSLPRPPAWRCRAREHHTHPELCEASTATHPLGLGKSPGGWAPAITTAWGIRSPIRTSSHNPLLVLRRNTPEAMQRAQATQPSSI